MVEKVDFISGCPVFGCSNSKSHFEWVHSKCGGHEWLDQEGNIECKKCSQKDMLIAWKFKCMGHSDYREVNNEKICEILSISASLEKGSKKFKSKLLKAVANMLYKEDEE